MFFSFGTFYYFLPAPSRWLGDLYMLVFLRVIIPTFVTRYRIGAIKSKSTRIGAITVFIQKYIPASYIPYIVHTNVTAIVNIRPSLDILFRFLTYKTAKMAAGIKAVPWSEAIKTIGKNNSSSIHLPHLRPNPPYTQTVEGLTAPFLF